MLRSIIALAALLCASTAASTVHYGRRYAAESCREIQEEESCRGMAELAGNTCRGMPCKFKTRRGGRFTPKGCHLWSGHIYFNTEGGKGLEEKSKAKAKGKSKAKAEQSDECDYGLFSFRQRCRQTGRNYVKNFSDSQKLVCADPSPEEYAEESVTYGEAYGSTCAEIKGKTECKVEASVDGEAIEFSYYTVDYPRGCSKGRQGKWMWNGHPEAPTAITGERQQLACKPVKADPKAPPHKKADPKAKGKPDAKAKPKAKGKRRILLLADQK